MIDKTTERVLEIYQLLPKRLNVTQDLRKKLYRYLTMLHEAGEQDAGRMMVFGVMYLRQADGRYDAVKSGFTGL